MLCLCVVSKSGYMNASYCDVYYDIAEPLATLLVTPCSCSLGLIMWEMLSGEPPWKDLSQMALMAAVSDFDMAMQGCA